ncbi:MAG: hypothetical protein KDA41_07395 [Planctomycetales bacterium]|nr:hypothetical protein [Planctomycetales bacterium]
MSFDQAADPSPIGPDNPPDAVAPIEAEAVPEPLNPLAFGMQALLGLTAIAGVQFALMAYLGPLAGLLIGAVVCLIAMGVLIASTVLLRPTPGTRLLDQLDKLAIRLVVGVVVLVFGSLIAGGGQLIYALLEDARAAWTVQRELGFTYRRQAMWDQNGHVTTWEITSVTTGGAFDQAGVQTGDRIVLDQSPQQFVEMLRQNRGQAVSLSVIDDAASQEISSIESATQREVFVQIPP